MIFKYTDQNPLELMQTVRNFVNFIKVNPSSREQFKTNRVAPHSSFHNKVNKSEIYASSLEQVQQLINNDVDLIFNALVAATTLIRSNAQMATTNKMSDSPRNTTQTTTSQW